MKKYLVILAALALTLSCTKENGTEPSSAVQPHSPVVLSLNASKAPVSKALTLDGGALKATWEEGEKVNVYKGSVLLGTMEPTTFGSSSTKLEGTIDAASLAEGDALLLVYPAKDEWTYSGQDGTLTGVSSSFDYATADVSISAVADGLASASAASFANCQAIVKFRLMDATGSSQLKASSLSVSSSGGVALTAEVGDGSVSYSYGTVVAEASAAASEFTMALRTSLTANDTFRLTAVVDGKVFTCVKEGVGFENGKYYEGTVKMSAAPSYTVAGDPESVFGSYWEPADENNDMEFDGTKYRKTYGNVPAGTIVNLKVVKDHSWGNYGENGYPERNVILTAWAGATLTVEFDPADNSVNAWMDYGGAEPQVQDVYTVIFADNYDIITPQNDLVKQADGTYAITLENVAAGTIWNFRITKNRCYTDGQWPYEGDNPYYYAVQNDGNVTITFNPADGAITVTEEAVAPVYTVAGSSVSLFQGEWDPSLTANDMELQSDGTYKKVYTVTAAEEILFKVAAHHDWSHGDWPSGNYEVNATAPGILTITFNPQTGEVNAWMEYDEPAGDTYTVVGEPADVFGSRWTVTDTSNDMTLQEDGTYVKSYEVAEETDISFRIAKNHSWEEAWPDGNYVKRVGAGTLYIYFNPSNGDITVVAPDPTTVPEYTYTVAGVPESVFGTEWDITNTDNDMILASDGTYYKTYDNVPEETRVIFKIVADHDWTINYGAANSALENSEGNCVYVMNSTGSLRITFDPSNGGWITASEN